MTEHHSSSCNLSRFDVMSKVVSPPFHNHLAGSNPAHESYFAIETGQRMLVEEPTVSQVHFLLSQWHTLLLSVFEVHHSVVCSDQCHLQSVVAWASKQFCCSMHDLYDGLIPLSWRPHALFHVTISLTLASHSHILWQDAAAHLLCLFQKWK